MELAPLVPERLSLLSDPLLPSAERTKVLRRDGSDVLEELKDDSSGGIPVDLDVEEDARVGSGGGSRCSGGGGGGDCFDCCRWR